MVRWHNVVIMILTGFHKDKKVAYVILTLFNFHAFLFFSQTSFTPRSCCVMPLICLNLLTGTGANTAITYQPPTHIRKSFVQACLLLYALSNDYTLFMYVLVFSQKLGRLIITHFSFYHLKDVWSNLSEFLHALFIFYIFLSLIIIIIIVIRRRRTTTTNDKPIL